MDDPRAEAGPFAQGARHARLGQAFQVSARRAGPLILKHGFPEGKAATAQFGMGNAARDQVAPMLALAHLNPEAGLHPLQRFGFNEGHLAGVMPRVVAGAEQVTIPSQTASGKGFHLVDALHPGTCMRSDEDGFKKGVAHVAVRGFTTSRVNCIYWDVHCKCRITSENAVREVARTACAELAFSRFVSIIEYDSGRKACRLTPSGFPILRRAQFTPGTFMPEQPTFLSLITGSFATPAAQNPTVAMIEAAYEHHRINARYINCDVAPEALGDAVRGARAMGWIGFNCSMPYKVSIRQYLDGLGGSAAVIGAVNCVVRRGGAYIGENTDGQGFLTALRTMADPAGKALLVFGAGGAARAIAVEAALAGAASITVVNRDPVRGSELVTLLNEKTPAKAEFVAWGNRAYCIPEASDIVVNATSIGMFPEVKGRLNLDLDSLRPGLVVADVIPNPPRTQLIQDAVARGCKVLDGLGMLVSQGVISIRYWTGIDPEPTVMRKTLEDIFGV